MAAAYVVELRLASEPLCLLHADGWGGVGRLLQLAGYVHPPHVLPGL
jgi:hypothetical protein